MLKKILITTVFLASVATANAAMTISGTRIIFPGTQNEVNVRTNNKGDAPALVQVWVDEGKKDANLNNVKVPFIVTPPVYRVEPGKGQSIRMIYNGMALPQDKESVFWFNLLEIPPKSKNTSEQRLELAFRTRIKIFYRPTALMKSSSEAERDKLQWESMFDPLRGMGIKVTNPTNYYFSFDSGSVMSVGRKIALNVDMIPPGQNRIFYPANKIKSGEAISALEYKMINDYGATVTVKMHSVGTKGFVVNDQ
ncbi:pilus assembly protein [Enterobacterales bacterium CwR94]|nr:pilus assembly protein [Enterobacterales bacterium CwR94]